MNLDQDLLYFAVPKGRILKELIPLMKKTGLEPEADFFNEKSRKLAFDSNHKHIKIIRVRSFDVATFVSFGAAQLGIVGSDVLAEFDYDELYAPVDLGIGKCRLSVAEPVSLSEKDDPSRWSHIRIATKYPHITGQYFAKKGVQSECVKLNGAMELAPKMGLCRRIVDLVSTGQTLKENGLKEIDVIMEVSAKLIAHRASYKIRTAELQDWINKWQQAVNEG